MMEESQSIYKYILQFKKIPNSTRTEISRGIGLSLFCLLAISLPVFFIYIPTSKLAGDPPFMINVFAVIIGIMGGIVLVNIKNEIFANTRFREIKINLNERDNLEYSVDILKKHFKIHDIEIHREQNMIRAITKISFLTWGDLITIVCDRNRILINSKANGSQFFSYGKNKRILDKFEKQISMLINKLKYA